MTGRTLIVTYAALVALALTSWLTASLGAGTGVALAFAAAKALAIALVFMELARAHAADRAIAAIAVFFVALLCAGALADVAFR
ncbi:MAG TPA: cytochrome C oxidase subunit IV family protein [Kofleriaceae bacterium]|jgi:caa(3)-type oxidase subunit IV|nr:cytochrome C oxidase subunit IV family protein [Kofleriaceae bacterium]